MGNMEKASAASAMDWSIELEKGLRSKQPGQHLLSIQLTGKRIEKWSQEPKLKLTLYNMFRMVHGEERLYADTILFRLANAFSSGDRETRTRIVEVFLSKMKHCDRKRKRGYGILSKMSSNNHKEILRRIEVALSDESIESKALTLVLFGCWSEIAKDFPEIRYEILSGLQSSHALEVKASFFAAGCFAGCSYDFACVFLERLTSIMASPITCSTVKIAAARAFGKMGHFHSVTNRAYKAGSDIVLKSPEADWSASMLISLSKLASKSVSLSSDQVSLLGGLLAHNAAQHMQLTVLRSLRHILEKAFYVTPGAFLFENLLGILDDKQIPSLLRCEALQLVVMIVLQVSHDMLISQIQQLNKLLIFLTNAAKSPGTSNPERVLATQALVGISNKLKGLPIAASELSSLHLLSEVVSSMGDEAILQTKQMSECFKASDIELQFKSFFQRLFVLIHSPPEVSLLVLDRLCIIVENLVSICRENMTAMDIASEVHTVTRVEENDISFLASRIIPYVHKHLLGFAHRLDATEATSKELLHKLKHLVSFVCQCNLFNCSTHVKFALLLDDGTLNHECIGNMLAGNDDWESYLIGKNAACQGAWYVCDSVFSHLKFKVTSDICSSWLSCLSQFAHSEKCLQETFSQDDFQQYMLTSDSIEMLGSARGDLLSSERLLGQTIRLKQTFCFQRWFLALRSKVLDVIADLLGLLRTVLCNQESISIHQQPERDSIMHLAAGLSVKSQKIAREYDLMNSSFINMDHKSLRVISSIALNCSLLAFCIGLAYFIPNSPFSDKPCSSKDSDDRLLVTLVEDLAGRLSQIDPETSTNILSILKGDDAHSKTHSLNIFSGLGKILTVCKAAIGRIRSMTNDAGLEFPKRARYLLDITKELMNIQFRTPKSFFRVGPCIGAILYTCSIEKENSTDISVISGSHLSLNLCLQLKNMPPNLASRITKVFCILHCKKSSMRPPYEPEFVDYQSWSTDSMLRLHEKIRYKVIEQDEGKLSDSESETFVGFETNGGVQGFTSCLIDVSAFPVGVFRIDWCSCCIDDGGSLWSLLPLSFGPLFTVRSSKS